MDVGLTKLRDPFAATEIGSLPRVSCTACRDERSGHCDRHQRAKCQTCGNHLTTAHIHLDYVGHAAVTNRLLDVDPEWNWEPVAFDGDGLPVIDRNGGLWIRLTVLGVTRLGYGHADGRTGGDAVKIALGDCFVRGTPIMTGRGVVPIEDVRAGDIVPTRAGWKPVTDHWLSSPHAPVVTVSMSDGRTLTGTPHHRVPTTKGEKRIGALRRGDRMLSWQATGHLQTGTNRSNGTVASTGAIPIPNDGTTGTTFSPRPLRARRSMLTSTRRSTDPYQTVTRSITSTMIPVTTLSAISSRCLRLSTKPTMLLVDQDTNGSVIAVIRHSTPASLGRAGAPLGANKPNGEHWGSHTSALRRDHTSNSDPASCAESPTWPRDPGRVSAGPYVNSVTFAGTAEVWNLSVGDTHEYVANGIVVFNSIRNAAMRFGVALDLWHKGELSTDTAEPTPEPAKAAPNWRDPAVWSGFADHLGVPVDALYDSALAVGVSPPADDEVADGIAAWLAKLPEQKQVALRAAVRAAAATAAAKVNG